MGFAGVAGDASPPSFKEHEAIQQEKANLKTRMIELLSAV
jgi:hypothetical protein